MDALLLAANILPVERGPSACKLARNIPPSTPSGSPPQAPARQPGSRVHCTVEGVRLGEACVPAADPSSEGVHALHLAAAASALLKSWSVMTRCPGASESMLTPHSTCGPCSKRDTPWATVEEEEEEEEEATGCRAAAEVCAAAC